MNSREKDDCVRRYKNLDRQINKLCKERESWKAIAETTTPTISDMPHGNDGENHRELAICNMVDCDTEANRLIDELVDLRWQIEHYITTAGDNDKRLLAILEIEK